MTLFTIILATIASALTGIYTNNWLPSLLAGIACLYVKHERMQSFATLASFATAYGSLVYAFGTSRMPFVDAELAYLDSLLCFEGLQVSPVVHTALTLIYFALTPMLVVFFLFGSVRPFMRQFIICALIAAMCFFLWPALGRCGPNGPAYYRPITEHLIALKQGTIGPLAWTDLQGIITFPSCHCIFALLLAKHWPNWFTAAFAGLTVPAAIVIGQHYLVDCLGGILLVYLTNQNHKL